MSRVAKKPIQLPTGVELNVCGQDVTVKSSKGVLKHTVHQSVKIESSQNGFTFLPLSDSDNWALAGTTRALVANMVEGLSKGYTRELELVGVGYKVKAEGTILVFSLGYSHPIHFSLPEGVTASIDKQVLLTLTSADKQLLGQCAANIRKLRKPDAYKGKGVRAKWLTLKLKEVKKK